MSEKQHADVLEKISSGIEGFDDITAGGLPLRRTTLLAREMLRPEDALDLDKTVRVALAAVTKMNSEMALIALAVAASAAGFALLLRKGDCPFPGNEKPTAASARPV